MRTACSTTTACWATAARPWASKVTGGYMPDADVTIVIWSNAAESNVAREIVPAIAGAVVGGDPVGQSDQAGQGALPRSSRWTSASLNRRRIYRSISTWIAAMWWCPGARGASERAVKLGVMRINSGQGPAASPLFMLAGGPGRPRSTRDSSACCRQSCWAASWELATLWLSSSAAPNTRTLSGLS